MKTARVPKLLQSALWSYNLDKMSLENPSDKNLIVQQILNYGTKMQVDWLLKNISQDDIKASLKKPLRGSWWEESLNYWTKVFGVRIDKNTYERAIQNINPQT